MIVIDLGTYTLFCVFTGILFGFITGFATAAYAGSKVKP